MRKLASVQQIKFLRPIENADFIEVAGVLGWECVVTKGQFKAGDICIYCEIDSWVPNSMAPFLSKGKEPREYNGVKGERLKTVKLRSQISQGLILPLSVLPINSILKVGDDVTELLNIQKYEPPVPAQIQGDARGFCWPISKTDEERVQNNDKYGFVEALWDRPYYISLKLDGTSSTFLIDNNGEYHVCGRNFSYKKKLDHMFWILSEKYDIENKLRKLHQDGLRVAIQGEVIGSIQGNKMKLKEPDLYIFNVVDIESNKKFSIDKSLDIIKSIGLNFVPILESGDNFKYTIDELFALSDRKYKDFFPNASPEQQAEGIVVRSKCSSISFKVINNNFLLKENE